MTNGLSLTQQGIKPIKGQAAFLPNQPIIHNCVVDPSATAALQPGDVVTFATTTLTDLTVVKKAASTDTPIGVVVFNAIKSAFMANDRVSIFPVNSFVYLPAASAALTIGSTVSFNSDGQVVAASAGNGNIGILWTQAAAEGDLVVVQIQPGTSSSTDLSDYLTTAAAASTYVPQTRTINSKALSADITLTASDVGAEPAQG